jgi:hypothetical protein
MKPLLPLAVLLAVGIGGCSKSDPKPDPKPDLYAKYRDVQLTVGMKIADIKQQFGEPDMYESGWSHSRGSYISSDVPSKELYGGIVLDCPYRIENLGYRAFGVNRMYGDPATKYYLSMTFVDGELYKWEKSTPGDKE